MNVRWLYVEYQLSWTILIFQFTKNLINQKYLQPNLQNSVNHAAQIDESIRFLYYNELEFLSTPSYNGVPNDSQFLVPVTGIIIPVMHGYCVYTNVSKHKYKNEHIWLSRKHLMDVTGSLTNPCHNPFNISFFTMQIIISLLNDQQRQYLTRICTTVRT